MKTIEEQAREYALCNQNCSCPDGHCDPTCNACYHKVKSSFLTGAEAATRWISVNEDPIPENGEFIILDLNNQVWTKEQFGNAMIIATHWLPIPPMPEK